MQFLHSIWKILHLTEYFYTGTARGARNNYQVWTGSIGPLPLKLFQKIMCFGTQRPELQKPYRLAQALF